MRLLRFNLKSRMVNRLLIERLANVRLILLNYKDGVIIILLKFNIAGITKQIHPQKKRNHKHLPLMH